VRTLCFVILGSLALAVTGCIDPWYGVFLDTDLTLDPSEECIRNALASIADNGVDLRNVRQHYTGEEVLVRSFQLQRGEVWLAVYLFRQESKPLSCHASATIDPHSGLPDDLVQSANALKVVEHVLVDCGIQLRTESEKIGCNGRHCDDPVVQAALEF